jgi:hypothetical protein
LPDGDIVFLRQVLQHLNNSQISRVVQKLYRYKFLVLTEHVPANPAFTPTVTNPPEVEPACRKVPASYSPNIHFCSK